MAGRESRMKTLEELQIECARLQKENAHLRQLLNLDLHASLTILQDKLSKEADAETLPTENGADEPISNTSTLSVAEKIALYRSLFRGRDDVHAVRWENKNGRSGYSPVCANEWDRRVCRKPQIKCNECPHSKWISITDQVLYDHLAGKHMIGVYPLLQDETCCFLAIDFDKTTWQKDALAFINICRKFSISAALERSQSGNGAHIWIFFKDAIPARLARLLGTGLLTQTMQQRHDVSLDSYDRLFPNQDTMPKGGFGNLIALPLQGARRKKGNSLFLNDSLEPYTDPWSFLATIQPLSQQEVLSLIDHISQQGHLLDVRSSQTDEDYPDPWVTPQANSLYPIIDTPLPEQIELVLANLLYVPHGKLSSVLVNQIKKIAAFQNPEFYRAQAMRISTYGKPRIISCAEEFPEYVGLPRGCESDLIHLLDHYKIKFTIRDETQKGKSISADFSGKLRPEQKKSFKELLCHRYGILAATTAFGKTVIAAKVIAERKINTLVLVHRQQLLEQWRERLSVFLDMSPKDIGILGGGRNKLTGNIDVAMLQSISKQGDAQEEITQYGQIIVDECHHLSAFSFEQVLKKARAHYVLGLTATPIRKDGHHPIILMQCGPIRHRVSSKSQIKASQMQHRVCVRHTNFCFPDVNTILPMNDVYQALVNHVDRNEQIFNDVLSALENKRVPLLLTERTQHLEWFAERFSKFVKHVFVLQGGMKRSQREGIFKALSDLPDDEDRLILATGKYIGEGFDDPRLDTLFLALPISWQGTLQQYVGRLHRLYEGKRDVVVYDYIDNQVPVLTKMYQKRMKKYRAMGYIVDS
jgi:superfamily II DNA or RNA helicase